MLGPVLGLMGTVFGMVHAFRNLGDNGVADPKALSSGVAMALHSTMAGLILFPCGMVLFTVCMILIYQSPPDERGRTPEALRQATAVPPPLPPEQ